MSFSTWSGPSSVELATTQIKPKVLVASRVCPVWHNDCKPQEKISLTSLKFVSTHLSLPLFHSPSLSRRRQVYTCHSRSEPFLGNNDLHYWHALSFILRPTGLDLGANDFLHQSEFIGQVVSALMLNLLLQNSRTRFSFQESRFPHSFPFFQSHLATLLGTYKRILLAS